MSVFTTIIKQLINGLQSGSIYALVALGYSMVYGIIMLLNFAHGDVIMVGAYIAWMMMARFAANPIIALIAAVIGCTVLVVMNILLIPRYSYMACAWAGFCGYGIAMLLSYFVGQKKYPIQYDLKAIGSYVLLAAVLYLAAEYVPIENIYLRMAYRTVLLLVFVAYIVKRDLPLSSIPVINRLVKK